MMSESNDCLTLKPWFSVNLTMKSTLRPDANHVRLSCYSKEEKGHDGRKSIGHDSSGKVRNKHHLQQPIIRLASCSKFVAPSIALNVEQNLRGR